MPTNLSSLHENKTTGEAEAHTSLSPLLVRAQQQREKKTIVLFAVFLAHCNKEPTKMTREEPNFELKIVLLWVSAGHSGHSCSLLACGSTGAPPGGEGVSAAIQHEGGIYFVLCLPLADRKGTHSNGESRPQAPSRLLELPERKNLRNIKSSKFHDSI